MIPSREKILEHVREILTDLFEIDRDALSEDALLYDDLDIDSIDAIDLLIELKQFIDKDIDAHEFKDAKTLGDVVNIIDSMREQ